MVHTGSKKFHQELICWLFICFVLLQEKESPPLSADLVSCLIVQVFQQRRQQWKTRVKNNGRW